MLVDINTTNTNDLSQLEEILRSNRNKLDSMDELGNTLLHRSIIANRIEIVRLLIQLGANATLANRDGWSPIHLACFSGNSEILNYFINNLNKN